MHGTCTLKVFCSIVDKQWFDGETKSQRKNEPKRTNMGRDRERERVRRMQKKKMLRIVFILYDVRCVSLEFQKDCYTTCVCFLMLFLARCVWVCVHCRISSLYALTIHNTCTFDSIGTKELEERESERACKRKSYRVRRLCRGARKKS